MEPPHLPTDFDHILRPDQQKVFVSGATKPVNHAANARYFVASKRVSPEKGNQWRREKIRTLSSSYQVRANYRFTRKPVALVPTNCYPSVLYSDGPVSAFCRPDWASTGKDRQLPSEVIVMKLTSPNRWSRLFPRKNESKLARKDRFSNLVLTTLTTVIDSN